MTVYYQNIATVPPAPTNLTSYITTLNPVHWWKHDETSGTTLLDSGSNGTLDLNESGGNSFFKDQDGPTDDSSAYDRSLRDNGVSNSTNFHTLISPPASSSAGSIVVFYNYKTGLSTLGNVMIGFNSGGTDYDNAIVWSFGAALGGNNIELVYSGDSLFHRRVWRSDPDTGTNADAWNVLVLNADGMVDPVIFLNGNSLSLTESTSGTPPSATRWFSSLTLDRTTIGATSDGGANRWNEALTSHMFIMNRILTSQEITDLAGFIV